MHRWTAVGSLNSIEAWLADLHAEWRFLAEYRKRYPRNMPIRVQARTDALESAKRIATRWLTNYRESVKRSEDEPAGRA